MTVKLPKPWTRICAAAVVVLAFAAVALIKPATPGTITLLTGPESSAYHELGLLYADDLRRRGLDADVVVTDGAVDNLRRLVDDANSIAFGPSTQDWMHDADVAQLVALGSVGVEPLWFFFRGDLSWSRMPDLSGAVIATEGQGAASDHVARTLIEKNGLADSVQFQPLDGPTSDSLLAKFDERSIDGAFVTGDANTTVVRALLDNDALKFLSFDRAAAYAGLIPGVTKLVAPEGVLDLARNLPGQDAQLLSAATCLIANKDLHPAVVPMLLIAAENVGHQRATFFTTATFPSPEHVTLPLASAARRYFNQGETGISKYLPYKVTRWLNHLGFFVLPLLTAAVVLLRIVPMGLRVWCGIRLKRLFKRLEAVEKKHAGGGDAAQLVAELDRIDAASAKMFVPRSSVHDYVDFRQFLHDMRDRVSSQDGE